MVYSWCMCVTYTVGTRVHDMVDEWCTCMCDVMQVQFSIPGRVRSNPLELNLYYFTERDDNLYKMG